MSEKLVGFGSLLQVDDNEDATFTTVAGVRNISRGGAGSNIVDTTTQDNATRYETKAGGTVNPGQVTFDVAYDPADASHKVLAVLHGSQAAKPWKLTYTDTGASTEPFSAIVQELGQEIPLRELVTRSVTLEVSGPPGFPTS